MIESFAFTLLFHLEEQLMQNLDAATIDVNFKRVYSLFIKGSSSSLILGSIMKNDYEE